MDGSNPDQNSDSDSCESWTLLERCPSCADDALAENTNIHEEEIIEKDNSDKEEDTDGISIISESDPENISPCEHFNYHYESPDTEDHPIETNLNQNFAPGPDLSDNAKDSEESIGYEDDFLTDNSGKLKTYVHRRNKKLSTVLNIILLGSVITAAGVAVGHMWGVRDDCLVHSTSSVNKILSNLYKLQEENVFLRNKIKELTNALQIQHKRSEIDKISSIKYPRCKKVFEEPLDNKDAIKATKCVDYDFESHMIDHSREQEFLSDINKLKAFYKHNKSWLDNEIVRRLKDEEASTKKVKNSMKDKQNMKTTNLEIQLQQPSKSISEEMLDTINLTIKNDMEIKMKDKINNKKMTYADSLKLSADSKSTTKEKEENNGKLEKRHIHKKMKGDFLSPESSLSDLHAQKDDRHMEHRHKPDKKHDRQKFNKKQKKRKNKYEQWEMKGGYIKDYDELPFSFSDDDILKPDKNVKSEEYERLNYMKQFSEGIKDKYVPRSLENIVENTPVEDTNSNKKGEDNEDIPNWLQVRAHVRNEARKKLNRELFGENSMNSARWYFRRMQRREQYRSKGDNVSHRKNPKLHMNYKVKN